MFNFSKRIVTYILILFVIVSVPLIAMQFTDEVNWTLFDFLTPIFISSLPEP
jgi:galactitol-specific phosphotransferase system IIC component